MFSGATVFSTPRSVAAGGGGSFAISGVSGSVTHNGSITISGAQFGTKSTAGPVIYDDASGTDPITTGWSAAYPNSAPSTHNLAYRTLPTTNGHISTLPHSNVTKAICGCHHTTGGPNGGYNVAMEYDRVLSSRPGYTFVSYWERIDDLTNFGDGTDSNWKFYDWGEGAGPYNLPYNFYIENGQGGNSWESASQPDSWWNLNSDDPSPPYPLVSSDNNSHGLGWDTASNPIQQWRKVEILVKWTQDSTGYIKVWDNGTLRMDYSGRTDGSTGGWTGNNRYDLVGGYCAVRDVKNWRYFCDVYYDHTPSRVILGNASTIGACTIKEPQVCTSWASGSIGATVKKGAIPSGTAYLYVFDASNNSTPGFAVTVV